MKLIPSRRQAGFSLVELMIAVAIGLLMLTFIGGIYISTTRSFAATTAVTGMDENARALFDVIGSSVRQSAFNGCGRISSVINGDTRTIPVTGGIPDNWWQNTVQPVQGATLTSADGRFPNSHPANLLPAGSTTDVLMLVGVDSQNAATVSADDGSTITTGTGSPAFQPTQTLLATSCQVNSFFVATVGTSGATITHDASANCSASLSSACAIVNVTAAAGNPTLPVGSLILPVVANAYYIAPSGTPGKGNSLWSCVDGVSGNCNELSNGVENMAVYFGLDAAGRGSVDSWVPPGNVANWDQVKAVQVRLLLATMPDAGTVSAGGNAYTFNGATFTPAPTDRRVYREYTAIFSARNTMF